MDGPEADKQDTGAEKPRIMVSNTTYRVLDHGLALFVVTPIVVTFWRSFWYWLDQVLIPWDVGQSAWCSFLLGHCSLFVLTLSQDRLVHFGSSPSGFKILGPTFNLIYAFAQVFQWRSTWLGVSILTGSSLGSGLRGLVLSVMFLTILRSLGTAAIIPPFTLPTSSQNAKEHFSCPTWSRSQISDSLWRYTLDVAFSVFVVQSCAVVFWRSTWLLADLLFYPDSPEVASVLTSLLIGSTLTIFVYLGQHVVSLVCRRLRGLPRILFQNVWTFTMGLTCVNVWRGIWGTADLLLPLPNPLNLFLTVLVTLLLAQTYFVVPVFYLVGVVRDADFSRTRMAHLQIEYFTENVQRRKKQKKKTKSGNKEELRCSPEKVTLKRKLLEI